MDTLKKSPADRKCFRLIGGVLVGQTVDDILPGLEQQKTNIDEILKSLGSHYQKKVCSFSDSLHGTREYRDADGVERPRTLNFKIIKRSGISKLPTHLRDSHNWTL